MISVETAWTLTNILHGVFVYLFMHTVKGTPFHTADQGSSRFLTAWEQIDGEIQVNIRIPTVKLKIPREAFLKSESRTSVTFKL